MAKPLRNNFQVSTPDKATVKHETVDFGKRTDEDDVVEESVVVAWKLSEGKEGIRVGSKLSIDSRGSTVTPLPSNGTTVSNSTSMRSSDSMRSTSSIRSARAEELRRARMASEERLGEDIASFLTRVFSGVGGSNSEQMAERSLAKQTSSLAKRRSALLRKTGSTEDLEVQSSLSERTRRERLFPEERLGQNLGDFFSKAFSEPR